jgi:alkylation response protein AidB-like acyl-CoA dehydrogenase
MDFSLTDEQRMLQDTVQRLIRTDYTFENRQAFAGEKEGFSRENWAKFAELGLLGLTLSEASGGFGGGGIEQMLIMEAFGSGLVVEPYLASVLIAGRLLERAGSAAQKETHLPALVEGRTLLAFAHEEPQARYRASDVVTQARRDGEGYVLNGRKSVVLHGDSAGLLLVSARTSGERRDVDGISLFLVNAADPGVIVQGYSTVDALRAADIELENVAVGAQALVGEEGQALAPIEYALDCGVAALCADTLGAATAAAEMTQEYIKTRKQFGVPIGTFQVLQHRVVDMAIELEQIRSMTILAASQMEAKVAARKRAISAAKYKVDQAARFVGQQAIQLHGGIGMTDEYAVGHYFKRITMNARRLADPDHHLKRFIATAAEEGVSTAATPASGHAVTS